MPHFIKPNRMMSADVILLFYQLFCPIHDLRINCVSRSNNSHLKSWVAIARYTIITVAKHVFYLLLILNSRLFKQYYFLFIVFLFGFMTCEAKPQFN